MKCTLALDRPAMGRYVAEAAAKAIQSVIDRNGHANLLVATGASQFEVLAELRSHSIEWSRVVGMHLDEYVGLSDDHPASFCRYLRERFVQHVPLREFHYIDGLADPQTEITRLAKCVESHPIDVALIGIGENAHIAFNDPPADFETTQPYLCVDLDEACRQQQVREGWFESLNDVPTQALSMSVNQIMKSKRIFCTVPDGVKANAIAATMRCRNEPQVPSSILWEHAACELIIDEAAAEQLDAKQLQTFTRLA